LKSAKIQLCNAVKTLLLPTLSQDQEVCPDTNRVYLHKNVKSGLFLWYRHTEEIAKERNLLLQKKRTQHDLINEGRITLGVFPGTCKRITFKS